MPRARAARDCRRESVATDSRVLCLSKAVNVLARPSGGKIFRGGECAAGAAIAPAQTRANDARRVRARRNSANRFGRETPNSPALLAHANFFVRVCADKRIVRRALHRRPRCGWRRASGAAVTHKIKRTHCYFFPAVVIGWQCWSIRDRTVPMSPSTQARRAAMAKKRKTKAAAKKTARKTTKRKKKK
jgi:hypothetical protein